MQKLQKLKRITQLSKKEENHDKIVLSAQTKLHTIEVLIYKASIDSNNIYEEFASVNSVLRDYNETKEEIKTSEASLKYTI